MVEEQDRLQARPTLELIGRLITQVGELARTELSLAQIEMRAKSRVFASAGVLAGIAVLFGLLAAGGLLVAAIALLNLVLPLWAAALIVMVAFFVVAALFALAAKSAIAKAMPPVPEHTLQSLREDLRWTKTRLGSSAD